MARPGIRYLTTLAALIASFTPPLHSAWQDYEGKPVVAVTFDPPDQWIRPTGLDRMVAIPIGAPCEAEAIRKAIERLYDSGRYSDIQVDAELKDGGVALRFITTHNWFLSRVSVTGAPDPPNSGQLVNATKLDIGTVYDEQQLVTAVKGLQQSLLNNGFLSPRIQPLVDRHPEEDELLVRFDIDSGRRASYTTPDVIGNPERPLEKIISATGWRSFWGLFGWRQVTEARTQRGIERLRGSYQKTDHLLAKARLEDIDHNRDQNTVKPTIFAEAGPVVVVRSTGAKISKGRMKELIPVYQERTVDQDLLMEGQRKLTEYFQSRGYFDTEVSFDETDETTRERGKIDVIEYDISRGDRYKLVHLEIRGNRYFDVPTLRERMYVTTAGWLRVRSGRYSEALLERDLNAIRDLYRANGFRDVEVTSKVEKNYLGRAQRLAVYVNVKEGPQWFVGSVDMSGVDLQLLETIQSMIQSNTGQPYSAFNIATDRDNILNYYFNNGYPNATLDIVSTQSPEPNRMDLKFVAQEGRRQYVRGVLLGGLSATRPSLVQNRISVRSGAPLSQLSMVETQRRLYDLGIFARVDMAVQNPDGLTTEKNVIYQFEEARKYSYSIGVGAEIARIGGSQTSLDSPAGGTGFSPRVSLGVSRLNFLGIGHTVGLQGRISTIQRRVVLTYFAPQLQGHENLNLTLSGLYDDSRNVRTFSSIRAEATVQLGQRISKATTLQYRATYRRVSVDQGTLQIEPQLIPLLSQPVRVGLLGISYIRDRRDDPADAKRGVYTTLDTSVAARAFASQTSFLRLLGRNASYHKIAKDVTFARELTFGWIYNMGNREIPLPERFFAGGAVSHRGFPENQAGPRDLVTGFPIGGRALLVNQSEIRFPLIGENIRGALFHDAGNVYTSIQDISFRFHQRDDKDFDYMAHAVGFGIRYRTPIGPVRVDLAYAINSPRFVGFEGTREDLLFGRGTRTSQRINQFQFHFSLGQSF